MIRVLFKDQASRDAFADRFKLTSKVDTDKLDIGWHLLQFAKLDDNATDYEQTVVLSAGPMAAAEHEFIVKGDPANIAQHAAIIKDLGNGFYHVSSSAGLTLADVVESIEHTSSPMTFLSNVSNVASMSGDSTDLDPQSDEAQWPRIRVASRYRPLLESFSTHEMTYKSVPELYIMDTGINASHPEFQYDGLEIVNFYSLPVFNGSFADDVGHGTAVSSMAAGKNLGITNNVKLMVVKIGGVDHSATLIEVGEAIDAIVAEASADLTKSRIVNMSWGIARSAWLDAKVQSLVDLGITVVCAAGNDGIDVEDISPAGLDSVMTIASIDKYDIPSGFNNISPGDSGLTTGSGLSLDMFAPGENVMVANYQGGYVIASGTSFSAPLVAGVATEIAGLSANMFPFSQMKQTLLDTATTNAILFEDDTFSENQNKIVYLFTSDPNANYKKYNMTMYLGVHQNNEPIVVDLTSVIDNSLLSVFTDDPIVWSIEWLDPTIEANYSPFMNLNTATGMLEISLPTVVLPEETRLKMIEFTAVATTSRARMTSPVLFYFQSNPDYADTLESDITLALTDTNSISFYATWNQSIK